VSEVARELRSRLRGPAQAKARDRDVRIAPDHLDRLGSARPVLIDDIISSGETMLEAGARREALCPPFTVAIGVHGLFADGSDKAIEKGGATLVTSDTISHASNRIEIAGLLAPAATELAG